MATVELVSDRGSLQQLFENVRPQACNGWAGHLPGVAWSTDSSRALAV